MFRASHRLAVTLLVAAAFSLGALAGAIAVAASSSGTANRELLGAHQNPVGAKGRTLGLSRVTIPAGLKLDKHRHEGTQVAYIAQGVLRYSVVTGQVTVRKGLANESPTVVRTIKAGQTGTLTAGDWIVEQPWEIHYASAKTKVIVWQATLLKNGAPPATPVK